MKYTASLFAFLVAVLIACGGEAPSQNASEGSGTSQVPVRTLAIVDSIGTELGDSDYVLGALGRLCFGPEGKIYGLDLVTGSVMIYSPDGEFVNRVSKIGEGPNEISFPLDMTVLNNGSIMISALGGIHQFTQDGRDTATVFECFQNPPMNLAAVGDSSLVCSKLTVEPDDDGNPVVNFWLGKLDDQGQPGITYATDSFTFDPQNLTDILNRTWLAYAVTADREGRVYLAPNSSQEFRIDEYDGDANLIRTITLDVPPVEKTEQEIREEKAWMEMHLENMGAGGVVIEYDPDPCRRMITDLGVDSQGRIWARNGTELNPVFEVFSKDGQHLFTARIPDVGDAGQFWRFAIEENGMAAYSENPESYQQIFLLQLQDNE